MGGFFRNENVPFSQPHSFFFFFFFCRMHLLALSTFVVVFVIAATKKEKPCGKKTKYKLCMKADQLLVKTFW